MIKLTVEISQDPDHPGQWTSNCVELDVISASRSLKPGASGAEAIKYAHHGEDAKIADWREWAPEKIAELIGCSTRVAKVIHHAHACGMSADRLEKCLRRQVATTEVSVAQTPKENKP